MINPGYHLINIKKGKLGQFSKVLEELDEIKDAQNQECLIMELVELSDLYGALKHYLLSKFGMSMKDLEIMSNITERAFTSGRRK